MHEITLTDPEKYAITLLHEGGESLAEDDLNEAGRIHDDDHQAATSLSIEMAHAIRDNPESFLTWFQSTRGEVEI